MQDALTEEMVGLAAQLRRNAQAMQESVRRRGDTLDSTEDAINTSLSQAQRSSKASKAIKSR